MIHKLKNKKQEQLLNKHLGKEDIQKQFHSSSNKAPNATDRKQQPKRNVFYTTPQKAKGVPLRNKEWKGPQEKKRPTYSMDAKLQHLLLSTAYHFI